MGTTAWGYVRTSGDERDDAQRGLKAQTEAIRAYAAFRGLKLQRVFADDDSSAAKPLAAREAGAELLERLGEAGRGRNLILSRLDRAFGSLGEVLRLYEEWSSRGLVLHVLDVEGQAVDTNGPLGKFFISTLRVAAELEVTKSSSPRPKRRDKPLLGERVVRGYIVPDEDELRAVARIQELSSRGKSLRTIAETLDEEGVPTKRRAKAWSKEAIRLVLQRIEKGEVRDLRRSDTRQQDT